MKKPTNFDRPSRSGLDTYQLYYEPLDGDGHLFGLKFRLRHLLRQRPTTVPGRQVSREV